MKSIFSFLLASSFILLMSCSGDKASNSDDSAKQNDKQQVEKSTPSPKEKDALPPTTPTPKEHLKAAKDIIKKTKQAEIADVDAALKYKIYCTACHGPKGDMNISGARDLTISDISMEERVAQVHFGKGLMTPFNQLMNDAEIVAVAKYIEKLRK